MPPGGNPSSDKQEYNVNNTSNSNGDNMSNGNSNGNNDASYYKSINNLRNSRDDDVIMQLKREKSLLELKVQVLEKSQSPKSDSSGWVDCASY